MVASVLWSAGPPDIFGSVGESEPRVLVDWRLRRQTPPSTRRAIAALAEEDMCPTQAEHSKR